MIFQVQFRLQQVVSAPSDKREDLLKELEHFAFRGIPNVSSPRLPDANSDKNDQNLAENELDEDKSITVSHELPKMYLSLNKKFSLWSFFVRNDLRFGK